MFVKNIQLLKAITFALGVIMITNFYASAAFANSSAKQKLQKRLSDYQGQVIYIDFWASWCKPCRKSFPWMNSLKTRFYDQGLRILAVNLDKDQVLAKEFIKNNPALFDIIFDTQGEIASEFKLEGMPMSFVLDRNGSVVASHVGFNSKKITDYEAEIVEALNQRELAND